MDAQSTEDAASNGRPAKRVVGRPWKPGQSGNPGGKPKGVASEARRLAGKDGRKMLKLLSDIAADEEQKTSDRIRAAELMLERGFGKAAAFAPIEGENPLALSDVDAAIATALDDLAPRREAQAARRGAVADLADDGETAAGTA